MLNIVIEIKVIIKEDRCNNSVKDIKKDYPDNIEKLEEALPNFIGENDLRVLRSEVLDNEWKYLTKKPAYAYEYFDSLDDYQKPVDNLKKKDLFSNLKNEYPVDI